MYRIVTTIEKYLAKKFFCTEAEKSCTRLRNLLLNLVLEPTTLASSGSLLEIDSQVLLQTWHNQSTFNKIPRWFVYTLFEKHWLQVILFFLIADFHFGIHYNCQIYYTCETSNCKFINEQFHRLNSRLHFL